MLQWLATDALMRASVRAVQWEGLKFLQSQNMWTMVIHPDVECKSFLPSQLTRVQPKRSVLNPNQSLSVDYLLPCFLGLQLPVIRKAVRLGSSCY